MPDELRVAGYIKASRFVFERDGSLGSNNIWTQQMNLDDDSKSLYGQPGKSQYSNYQSWYVSDQSWEHTGNTLYGGFSKMHDFRSGTGERNILLHRAGAALSWQLSPEQKLSFAAIYGSRNQHTETRELLSVVNTSLIGGVAFSPAPAFRIQLIISPGLEKNSLLDEYNGRVHVLLGMSMKL